MCLENGRDLVAAEYDGQAHRAFRTDEIVEPGEFGPKHVPVQEEQRTQRLVLRRRGHPTIDRQARQERRHLRRAHLGWDGACDGTG
jgi:hypothetical protein